MLRLIQLIVCEKVIIDLNGGTVSAIGMFENLNAKLPSSDPEKFLYPIKWSVVGLWRRNNEFEADENFVQKIIVRTPENEEAFTGETPFVATNASYNFRNIVEFSGFPVSNTGVVNIEIYLKRENEDEWVEYSSYPVNVTRTTEDMPNANETNAENTNGIENQNNSNESV